MPQDANRRLRVGVLGAGQIAQAAHFESCTKAANAELYAICDVADDLRERMAIAHGAEHAFKDYDAMLADPNVDAVIIATADAFHVPAAIQALEAGKHVLCEKPVGVTVEEVRELQAAVERSGLTFQVGHMKRFDAGLQAARHFIETGLGEVVALKAWYCDSTRRYQMTDAVQPRIVTSANAKKPSTRSEGRSQALLHARARLPPDRHGPLSRRRRSPRCTRGFPSVPACGAGSSMWNSRRERSGTWISRWPCGWTGMRGSSSMARTAAFSARPSIPGISGPARSRSSVKPTG